LRREWGPAFWGDRYSEKNGNKKKTQGEVRRLWKTQETTMFDKQTQKRKGSEELNKLRHQDRRRKECAYQKRTRGCSVGVAQPMAMWFRNNLHPM